MENNKNEIPKLIHYCWFGHNKKTKLAKKCIESWRKYLPDYKIICWDESNFDINIMNYTKQAYNSKKWAFVSDVARFYILYNYGGIYFDTDVEIIKPIDDIIKQGNFMGFEPNCLVAPGLGIGTCKKHPFINKILKNYEKETFMKEDGSLNLKTVVKRVTDLFSEHGLKPYDKKQIVAGFNIFPTEYFCPMKGPYYKPEITKNTRTIHHYAASWESKENKKQLKWFSYENRLNKKFSPKIVQTLKLMYFKQYNTICKKFFYKIKYSQLLKK